MSTTPNQQTSSLGREIYNKVPEITIFFWVIKVLCTTVGETAADFLNVNLNFGLSGTSIVTGFLLLVALFFQFRARKYIPSIYWITVVLISVFGTLVTDNLTDKTGIPLETSTLIFSGALAATFFFWYLNEKTLSIHSIFTRKREAFYWLTILFTFALGTAAGDLMAEGLGLGYLVTGIIVAATITVASIAWRVGLNPILSFWIIYILTRPLGASLGDLLSQPVKYGGLGLGATWTSFIFLLAILITVVYLSRSKKDVITKSIALREVEELPISGRRSTLLQVVTTLCLIIAVSLVGYQIRHRALQAEIANTNIQTSSQNNTRVTASSTAPSATKKNASPLGDVTVFRTITQDTLDLVNQGKLSDATTRIADLEHEWDTAQSRLKPMNKAKWAEVDAAIDTVLRQLRSTHPDAAGSKAALEALLAILN